MSKLRTKIDGKKKERKTLTPAQALEELPKEIKTWGGYQYKGDDGYSKAREVLPRVIELLVTAKYQVASVKAKDAPNGNHEPASKGDKKKAKLLMALVVNSLPAQAQQDVIWTAGFDGKMGANSWQTAARLRGDSPRRVVQISSNCKKPSAFLGKIEVGLGKAIAKAKAIKAGEPTNVKKTQLDILMGTFDKVYAKLSKANDGYPEEFNEHRRKSMAVELKDLMTELDRLIAHSQKDGD